MSARGFTLVELIAVLAIFSLVAVMSMQALSGSIRSRDALTRADDDAAELMRGLALLRNDLDAIIAADFHPPTGAREPPAEIAPGRLALSLGGQPRLEGETGMRRVAWEHDRAEDTLTRRSWPRLAPSDADRGPAAVVLTGVTGFEAAPLGGPADPDELLPRPRTETPPPRGIAVRIDTERHGTLRVVAAP